MAWLSAHSAAERAKVDPKTIRNHIKRGNLRATMVDGEWRITPEDLTDWGLRRANGKSPTRDAPRTPPPSPPEAPPGDAMNASPPPPTLSPQESALLDQIKAHGQMLERELERMHALVAARDAVIEAKDDEIRQLRALQAAPPVVEPPPPLPDGESPPVPEASPPEDSPPAGQKGWLRRLLPFW